MATYPIPIGSGRNARLMDAMRSRKIRYAWGPFQWYYQTISYTDMTLPAAATETVTLSTTFAQNTFPTNVLRGKAYIRLITAFSGGTISAMTAQIGDAGDPNGLLTATDVFTGASTDPITTVAAAEYADQIETAYSPQVLFTATGDNMDAVTAGSVQIAIGFRPLISF